jgi:tetratricopeptide (TPR) repeat protein
MPIRPACAYRADWLLSFLMRFVHVQEAAALFKEAVALNAGDDHTWLQYGLLERRRGQWESARTCFRKGLEVAPGNPYLYQVRVPHQTPFKWLAYRGGYDVNCHCSCKCAQGCVRLQLWQKTAVSGAAVPAAEAPEFVVALGTRDAFNDLLLHCDAGMGSFGEDGGQHRRGTRCIQKWQQELPSVGRSSLIVLWVVYERSQLPLNYSCYQCSLTHGDIFVPRVA